MASSRRSATETTGGERDGYAYKPITYCKILVLAHSHRDT